MKRSPYQKHLRVISGEYDTDNKIVVFLYLLMRDHLPCGEVAEILTLIRESKEFDLTNGFLATYAEHIFDELTKE